MRSGIADVRVKARLGKARRFTGEKGRIAHVQLLPSVHVFRTAGTFPKLALTRVARLRNTIYGHPSPRQTKISLNESEALGFAAVYGRHVKISDVISGVANKSQPFPIRRKSGALIAHIARRRRSELLPLACFDRKRKNAEGFLG